MLLTISSLFIRIIANKNSLKKRKKSKIGKRVDVMARRITVVVITNSVSPFESYGQFNSFFRRKYFEEGNENPRHRSVRVPKIRICLKNQN